MNREDQINVTRVDEQIQILFLPDPSKFERIPYNSPRYQEAEDYAEHSLVFSLSESIDLTNKILACLSPAEKELVNY